MASGVSHGIESPLRDFICAVRDLARHPAFNAWLNTWMRHPVSQPHPPPAAEEHIVMKEMQAVRARRETLNNMETVRQDRNGCKLTITGAVDEINETATDMEALYDATSVAKTHLGLNE